MYSVKGCNEVGIERKGVSLDERKWVSRLRIQIDTHHVEAGTGITCPRAPGTTKEIQQPEPAVSLIVTGPSDNRA